MHFQAEGCSQVPGLTLQRPVAALLPMPFPSPVGDGLYALTPETSHNTNISKELISFLF